MADANTPTNAVAGQLAKEHFVSVLKSALIAAAITALLGIPVLSHLTTSQADGLGLQSRWGLLAICAAVVFAGHLTINLLRAPPGSTRGGLVASLSHRIAQNLPSATWVGLALALFAFLLPIMPWSDRYVMDLAILVLTYVMLAWGLNIVVGLAGLLDLGYVAFYAVGAYSYALIAAHFGFSFWICLPLAGILAAFWGIILGFPVLRLRGDYLAIVTLAFGEIIRIVLLNWYTFTGGPDGLSGIPRPTFFGLEFKAFGDNTFADFFGLDHSALHRIVFLYYIILILAFVTNWTTHRLRSLPIGRAWEALREDEVACRSLGINTTNTKLTAFAIGAGFGGLAGAFFATRQGFISPESFTFIESAVILAIVVLGGMGSQIGIAISAITLIGGLELLRNLEFLSVVFGEDFDPTQYRMLVFGLAMVLMMVWRPRGFVATRTPSIALKESKGISGDLVQEGRG